MIVSVEGIDKTGKSTFCEAIAEGTSFFNFRCPETSFVKNEDKNMYDEADKCYKMALLASTTYSDVVFDRLHFSDIVYGVVLRKYDKAEAFNVFKKLDSELSKLGLLVYYFKPKSVAYSSLLEGRDLTEDFEMFEILSNMSKCMQIVTDYKHIGIEVSRLARNRLFV